jgi:hypothetical protein
MLNAEISWEFWKYELYERHMPRELLSINNSPEHSVVTDLERWKKSLNILCDKVQICRMDNSATFIQDIMTTKPKQVGLLLPPFKARLKNI